MEQRLIRDYEMSIWSLQDEFLALLKPAYTSDKKQTSEPLMTLNTDGTQELSFSIPMYLYEGPIRKENPIWYNTLNGNLIINMRKIKVIFNKNTEKEKIFDFLITKITERHENDQLYCDVECEGLAFHELGQTGYKISLSSDIFYDEDIKWFNENGDETERPEATLQYWLNQFLEPYPENGSMIRSNVWYYVIQMNWDMYSNQDERQSNKIYEEPYISGWITDEDSFEVRPKSVEAYKEKTRLVDLEESNKYNLTQDLAKTFGVFCKYEYDYDSNYHIIGRKIIFYNNFIAETEGYLSLTYPYTTNNILREIDSTELVTKMYIKTVDNPHSDSGWSGIADSAANMMLEDYLFNFDYLKSIGGLTAEQEEGIKDFQERIRYYNLQLVPLESQMITLNNRLPETQAALTIAINSVQLDKERLAQQNDLLKELDKKDGDVDGLISITATNPKTSMLIQDSKNPGFYYLNLTEKGVILSTIHMYSTVDYSTTNKDQKLTNEITKWAPEYDEAGNIIRLINIVPNENETTRAGVVYLIYKYNPALYYENIIKTWETRLNKDENDVIKYNEEVETINNQLQELQETYDTLLKSKKLLVTNFEILMGPALREGNWIPENFNDYGDKFVDTFTIPQNVTKIKSGKSGFSSFFWDNMPFDDEQKITYEIGVAQQEKKYPCLDLTEFIDQLDLNKLNTLSLLYYDYGTADETRPIRTIQTLSLGSQCQLGFGTATGSNTIRPILIITGAETMSDEQISTMMSNDAQYHLGHITTELENNIVTVKEDIYVSFNQLKNRWLTNIDKLYYPRIIINSMYLKNSTDQLAVKYNGTKLDEYAVNPNGDYSVTTREGAYYIRLNPRVLMQQDQLFYNLQVMFTLSNANTAIYLDAVQILKENAFPKVSYSTELIAIREDIIFHAYDLLARIININDNDLKLKNVQGYISEIELNLDRPWEDSVTIQNYKNKFEDLFSTIVAQTAAMQKNEYTMTMAAGIFLPNGDLSGDKIQDSLQRVDLNYSFNQGKLTIDEQNGIWATSDDGVVAIRGGGIFTATQKDPDDNWIWNTGILPSGINANLITTGQLDTNRIKIYAGDNLKMQMNADGLFAYKSFLKDDKLLNAATEDGNIASQLINNSTADIDSAQYVVFNEDGLFLRAEPDAIVVNNQGELITVNDTTDRVEISWKGLVLRNWNNDEVFYADADTGDLTLEGSVIANSGKIGPWNIAAESIYYKNDGLGQKGGLYWGINGLSLSDAFQIEVENDGNNTIFKNLTFNDPSQADPLLNFSQDDEGNYQLRLKNVQLDEEIIDGILSYAPQRIYSVENMSQLQSLTEIPLGSLGTIYQIEEPTTLNITLVNITQDTITDAQLKAALVGVPGVDVGDSFSLRDQKRLYPMTRVDQTNTSIYYKRWREWSGQTLVGAHVGIDTTYWNIGKDKDEYLYNEDQTGFVRAGLGTASARTAVAASLFVNKTIETHENGPDTLVPIAEGTVLTISFQYKNATKIGDGIEEAVAKPIKTSMTVSIYAAEVIGADKPVSKESQPEKYIKDYFLIGKGSISLAATTNLTNASLNITTTATTNYPFLYVIITNKVENSLKLINVNSLTMEAKQSTETKDDRGLYIYLPAGLNSDSADWYKLSAPTIPQE